MAGKNAFPFANRMALPWVVMLLASSAFGAGAPAAMPANAPAEDQLDEFVIQGKKLYQLRKEMVEAEDRFYKLYNELNKDDDYDVHCAKQALPGSRITERVCKPDFYAEAEADFASAMLAGYYAPPPQQVALERGDEYRARALAVINKYPELRRIVRQREDLERGYQKARKERFKNHWIQF